MTLRLPDPRTNDFAGVRRNLDRIAQQFPLRWPNLAGVPTVYNVRYYGAMGEGTTNDSVAIQAAIDAAYTAGGGIVWVPEGTFLCNVTIKPHVQFWGTGPNSSILKAVASSSTDVIGSYEIGASWNDTLDPHQNGVFNLQVHGNYAGNATGAGIKFVSSNSDAFGQSSDFFDNSPGPWIENVLVTQCYDDAVYLGANMRGSYVANCLFGRTRKAAISVNCTDSEFVNLQCGSVGDGIIDDGANNMWTNCKGWYTRANTTSNGIVHSGNGRGFSITGDRGQYTGCQTQDNQDGGGFYISGGENIVSGGFTGDENVAVTLAGGAHNNVIEVRDAWGDRTPGSSDTLLNVDGATTITNQVTIHPASSSNRPGGFAWYTETTSGTIAANTVSFGRVRARVYNSANISVPNNADTALTFDSERVDSEAVHSTSSNTSRLTAPRPGWYTVTGTVSYAANTTGKRRTGIGLNGTTMLVWPQVGPSPSGVTNMQCSTVYWLNAGDYVELFAFQDISPSASLNVLAAGNYSPEFSMSCE